MITQWSEEKVVLLIKRIFKKILSKGAHDLVDDAASLPPCPKHSTRVISCDTIIENTDFIIHALSPIQSAGHRVITQNLSDLAAMGAKPVGFVWSLEIPAKWLENNAVLLRDFCKSVAKLCFKKQLFFYGGDLSLSKDKFACTVTIFGDVKGKPLSRSGAKPGDAIFLSKPLGACSVGLRELLKKKPSSLIKAHLYPNDEIELGQSLVGLASSCMDISDGLSRDLYRLCATSKVSAILENVKALVHPNIASEKNAEEIALSSGEEYALLFTVPAKKIKKVKKTKNMIEIGTIISLKNEKPQVFIKRNLQFMILEKKGYDHFSSFSFGQALL